MNKRKNRPGPTRFVHDNRQQRGRTIPAQGIYNNSFFMHAATSFVGNLVQIQTYSGSVYEGVFRTFSPGFDVALELAHCIKNNQNKNLSDDTKNLPNYMIFQPNHIVSIISKDIDLDYATGGTFQTDSAISARCNGLRLEEKELEPWEPAGGNFNGDIDLELDRNANGWDANEMFHKNAEMFNVRTTFDDSLSDYTVQLEGKETQEFKEAEAKAEKLAQEIESNPDCRERLDLENGDEEALFAAVERAPEQVYEKTFTSSTSTITSNTTNSNITVTSNQIQQLQNISNSTITMSKGPNNIDKYVLPPKRKTLQPTNKVVRSASSSNNNNGSLSQHISHNNNKNINFQSMSIQNSASYALNQNYTHMHGGSSQFRHAPNVTQAKINGDGSNNSTTNKSVAQRSIRQYAPSTHQHTFVDHQSGQGSMGKITVHNHSHVGSQQLPNNMKDNSAQPLHISHQNHHTILSGGSMNTQVQAPQPQRQPRPRDDQIQDLRKFQQDFQLVGSNQRDVTHSQQNSQIKAPSASPHQPQQSLSPPQQQQLTPLQPQHQIPTIHHHQTTPQIQHHTQQIQQTENLSSMQVQKISQNHISQQEQQCYSSQAGSQQQSSTIVGTIITNNNNPPIVTVAPQQISQNISGLGSNHNLNNDASGGSDKGQQPPGVVKKAHVLNPSAKPFTPRSPSTPNQSRSHTPQTSSGAAMTPGVYTTGPHVASGQTPIYVMQPPQPPFQPNTHPHVGTQNQRLRRVPIATTQMQVSAATATGQPLLTAAPLPSFVHYQQTPHGPPFQSQAYQQMVRMYHEPPPQPIQFLAQTPPSTTPSPGQPHQHYHSAAQPSPAGGGPPAYGPATQPPPAFQMVCPVLTSHHPQLVPNYYSSVQNQTPHHAQQFQVIMQQQHAPQ